MLAIFNSRKLKSSNPQLRGFDVPQSEFSKMPREPEPVLEIRAGRNNDADQHISHSLAVVITRPETLPDTLAHNTAVPVKCNATVPGDPWA